MRNVGSFGQIKDTAPIPWETLKIWQNYQIAQELRNWFMNPDALMAR